MNRIVFLAKELVRPKSDIYMMEVPMGKTQGHGHTVGEEEGKRVRDAKDLLALQQATLYLDPRPLKR